MKVLLAVLLLSLLVNANNFAEFQFDVAPMSEVAFRGEMVEYHCVAPCDGIFWLINGSTAGADNNLVVSTRRSNREPGEESTLRIIASVYANNSAIECCIENREIGFETHSSPAYLTVQGLLSPPTNIQLALQRKGQFLFVTISWEQPFTLSITTRDNAIRYRVFIQFSGNSTLVHDTSTTTFIYNHSANIHCNNDIFPTFQVSAINQVGSSRKSDPINLHSVLCITSLTQGTSTVTGHSSSILNSNLAALHTRSTTVISPGTTLSPKPTVILPALIPHKNTETQMIVIIIAIATIVALFLIMLCVTMIIISSTIIKKRFNNSEMNAFRIPNSVSLELNANNAYDLFSYQKSCQHELSIKDTHDIYSEVEQPEALYAEIPT